MISRRTCLVGAAVFTVVAVCGSLVPFDLRTGMTLDRAFTRFASLNFLSIGPGSRSDWIANVLLFVPVGYLWLAALSLDETSRWRRTIAAAIVVLGSMLASLALEFTQIWFRGRTVSQNDVMAETVGALTGAVLWIITGQVSASWLRDVVRTRRKSQGYVRLLEIYLLGLLIVSVLPLDLTISTGELVPKLRSGGFVLVPFSDVGSEMRGVAGIIIGFVTFVPLGLLLAVWRTQPPARVRPFWITATAGLATAAAIELAQVFVASRISSTTDCLVGALGALTGGVFMQWFYAGRYGATAVDRGISLNKPAALWTLGAIAAGALVVLLFLAPYQVSGTPTDWRERYEAMWALPFSQGSAVPHSLGDILKSLIAFAVLGAFLGKAVKSLNLPDEVKRVVALVLVGAGAMLAFALEILQVMLPPHVPDITDVLLGALGMAAGVLLVFFL